jgi:hypothetical protein
MMLAFVGLGIDLHDQAGLPPVKSSLTRCTVSRVDSIAGQNLLEKRRYLAIATEQTMIPSAGRTCNNINIIIIIIITTTAIIIIIT